jgi:hypothetical protein
MKAVKAIYIDGQITLSELPVFSEPVEVLVVFPEATDDPWLDLLLESAPRPALSKRIKDLEEEIIQGKAIPLNDA